MMVKARISVRAVLTDEERIENWETLLEQTDKSKSDLVRDMLDAYSEEVLGDVELEEDEADEGDDAYHPDDDVDGTLSNAELKEIVNTEPAPAINPAHVPLDPLKTQIYRAEVMAAIARYKAFDNRDDEQIKRIIRQTVGSGTDDRNYSEYLPQIKDSLERESEASNYYPPAEDVVNTETDVSEMIDRFGEVVSGDEDVESPSSLAMTAIQYSAQLPEGHRDRWVCQDAAERLFRMSRQRDETEIPFEDIEDFARRTNSGIDIN